MYTLKTINYIVKILIEPQRQLTIFKGDILWENL